MMSSSIFTTAGGKAINVSAEALLKAKQLFADELEDEAILNTISTAENVINKSAIQNKDNGERVNVTKAVLKKSSSEKVINTDENTMRPTGFATAGGKAINVSGEALSKAQHLFADELEQEIISKKVSTIQHTFNEAEMQISNLSSQHENVAKPTFQKAGTLFPKKSMKDPKSCRAPIGFATAGGKAINVSAEALVKAKQLFADELEDEAILNTVSTAENVINESEIQNKGDNERVNISRAVLKKSPSEEIIKSDENIVCSTGFSTAGGKVINVSGEALSKAQHLFADELEQEIISKKASTIQDTFSEVEMQMSNLGSQHENVAKPTLQKVGILFPEESMKDFQSCRAPISFATAGGKAINISEEALLKAKQLFVDESEEEVIPQKDCIIEDSSNKHKRQSMSIQSETAGCSYTSRTKETLLKPQLFSRKSLDSRETTSPLTQPLLKRKIRDLDGDVPVVNRVAQKPFKKLRFSKDLERKSLIGDSRMNAEENDNPKTLPILHNVLISNGKLPNNTCLIKTTNESPDLSLAISDEIAHSTVALLAEEESCVISTETNSVLESGEKKSVPQEPSSPVIGQFIGRKRKNISKRKKSINLPKDIENWPIKENGTIEYDNISCKVSTDNVKKEKDNQLKEGTGLAEEKPSCNVSFANEFGDSQIMIDFIDESAKILQKRLAAALEQDKQINSKQHNKPKPTISKLYFHKKINRNNRLSWKEISKGNKPTLCTYKELIDRKMSPEILDITADTALAYKFRCADFYGQNTVQSNINGIPMEDGGCLILDENGYVGILEIKRCFLASPGVNPNFLPTGWVENHYRWIVWKLASVDRIKLGSVNLPRMLTPAEVLAQLKYRYDREIDRCERSALRKILEKDDVPSKRMVLCVSSISEVNEPMIVSESAKLTGTLFKLMLTDGWYNVPASVDQSMIKNIKAGKVKEGTKIITYGAELLNCDQGSSPLEVPEKVCLKIHTNSTRRARWDTRLGYIAPSGPIRVKLQNVSPDGGFIGKITVLVVRVYPKLYYEKTPAGESIFRNERCEEKASRAYDKECRLKMESFYVEAEKYFDQGKNTGSSESDSLDLAAYEWDEDRERLSKEEFLSREEQEELVKRCRMKEEGFKRKLESRLQESLPPARQVTPLMKIRIVDGEASAIVSIWSPNDEIVENLKEGNYISISNINPSAKRAGELQLTAGRSTLFNSKNACNVIYPHRIYTPLCDIIKPGFTPLYGEFDTVGIVVSIGNEPCGMKNFEAVYLACLHSDSNKSSYLAILFWQGISNFGYTEILPVGSFVACSNLEWRRPTSWTIPTSYCTERSTFTRNPRGKHLQEPLQCMKALITETGPYIAQCAMLIEEEVQKRSAPRTPDCNTPCRNSSDKTIHSKTHYSTSLEYSPQNETGSKQTPKSADIQRRIEKLKRYGEPPKLSPIVLNNSSKRVLSNFQSPLRSSHSRQSKPHIQLKFTNDPK